MKNINHLGDKCPFLVLFRSAIRGEYKIWKNEKADPFAGPALVIR